MLLLLFLTATLTGSVMRLFQAELQAVVSLAVFIPLLIGTGGNAGSQTTATVIFIYFTIARVVLGL